MDIQSVRGFAHGVHQGAEVAYRGGNPLGVFRECIGEFDAACACVASVSKGLNHAKVVDRATCGIGARAAVLRVRDVTEVAIEEPRGILPYLGTGK